MSTSVYFGCLSFSATEGQFRQPSVSYGTVASVIRMEAGSPVRNRGLGGLASAALVELEPAVAEPRPALVRTPSTRPVWSNYTLPGVMAGKRPAPNCYTLPGVMAGKRPAPNCPV